MDIPSPIVWEDINTDKIADGVGDASVGTCGTGVGGRDGSNGYDSHTYIRSVDKGVQFDNSFVGTEDGDSLSRNPPALWDETGICNQFIGDRIYGVTRFKYNTPTLIAQRATVTLPTITTVDLKGNFYIPSSPILTGSYTKTLQARVGGDRGGKFWDRVLSDDFKPRMQYWDLGDYTSNYQTLSRFFFSFTGGEESFFFVGDWRNERTSTVVENGNDITEEDYTTKSLNDRRVFLRIKHEGQIFLKIYDTGLTLADYLDGGCLFRVKVTQTSIAGNPRYPNKFNVGTDVEYTIPETQFSYTKSITSEYNRCDNGEVRLKAYGNEKNAFILPNSGPFAYLGGVQSSGWRLVNHDPWWVSEINSFATTDDRQFIFIFPWINDLRVTDGTFSDTAAFRIAEFKHLDSSGTVKLVKKAADYDSFTIPDATEINIGEVETGDTFTLGLDNEGEVTTEVSAITFDTPFISTVDDSTPTLLPYQYQTVSFTTSAATTGSSDIVITHDKNNLLIPSPWTLTLTTQSGPIDGGGAGGI